MKFSDFLLRIIFLFIPGMICLLTLRQLKGRKTKKDWESFLEILLYSVFSYFIYYTILIICQHLNIFSKQLYFIKAIFDTNLTLKYDEIIYTSIISFFFAFAIAPLHTYKIINKFGRLIRVTKRYGDEDVWDFFHNMPGSDWVIIRDHKLDLVYYGWIHIFSDSEKERELLIQDVRVCDNQTGDFLYESPAIYISRNRDDITIEIPNTNNNQEENNE